MIRICVVPSSFLLRCRGYNQFNNLDFHVQRCNSIHINSQTHKIFATKLTRQIDHIHHVTTVYSPLHMKSFK